ncbi:MAG: delta-60 repeat domain-containing protein, partial [Chthoniobacterales bacterium]
MKKYSLFALTILLGGTMSVRGQSRLITFNPNANLPVFAVVAQPDGKILLGGNFTTFSPNGGAAVTRNRIARLNPDGTVDTAFNPNANADVDAIALQADGKILLGGFFTTLSPNGGATVTRNRIARLNADGTLDTAFNPNANGSVRSIALQADGRILAGGQFTTLSPNGGAAVTRNRIARLNTDGTLDTPFDPNANNTVFAIAVQANGKILAGGFFITLTPNGGAAVTRNRIARLNADGTIDMTFDPNANAGVFAIAI